MDQTDWIQELEAELDKAAQEIRYLRERTLRLSLTNPTSRIHPDAPAKLHFQVLLRGEPGTIDEEVTNAVRQGLEAMFKDRETMVREIEFLRSHLGPHLWADYERTIGMCGRQPAS
jgi:hypothetical protein